jgi:hypothetical protein
MSTILYAALGVLAVGLVVVVAPTAVDAWLKYRGRRVITCPETRAPAGVTVNAGRAVLSAVTGSAHLQLSDCTRWPEREHCGQECLAQVEEAPQDCLVRTVVANWYIGKSCALCGHMFGPIRWSEHQPALMTGDRRTKEWSELPADRLDEVFATHRPVCWDCHITETLRRKYPDRMVYRDRTAPPRA